MKRKILSLVCLVLVLAACKKKDETLLFLTGTLSVESIPELYLYHGPGDAFVFRPSGLSASDGTHIAYYFTDPVTAAKDTIMSAAHPETEFRYQMPDVLKTCTMTCTGFAEGSSKYYVSSSTSTFTIVDSTLNSGSLCGFVRYPEDREEVFSGTPYIVTDIGTKSWMRQNLARIVWDENNQAVFGVPYESSPVMRKVFGAYYTWEEAQLACPDGWRLPAEEDWVEMARATGVPEPRKFETFVSGAGNLMCKTTFNGDKMWDFYREVNITDKSRLSVMPTGYAVLAEGKEPVFADFHEYAGFWTSDEQDGEGVYRYLVCNSDKIFVATAPKAGLALSVRCIR